MKGTSDDFLDFQISSTDLTYARIPFTNVKNVLAEHVQGGIACAEA